MKRDMELIRNILLAVEASETGWAGQPIKISGYDQHEIGYHCLLLIEAGLCEGQNFTSSGSKGSEGLITRLNWEGHDFLEAIKEPSRWKEAKAIVVDKLGNASFQVWTSILTKLMLQATALT